MKDREYGLQRSRRLCKWVDVKEKAMVPENMGQGACQAERTPRSHQSTIWGARRRVSK
jgi:hypothetical protein